MFDAIIIGAGVIGVAVARALSLAKPDWQILVLEKEDAPARHTSGRNSGVVHSGFNLKPGSLKAHFCVAGSRMLREYCRKHSVPLEESGTVVAASTPEEIKILEDLYRRGQANGTPGLRLLDARELKKLEPNAIGLAALHSPTGAIVDSKALVRSLAAEAQERGVKFQFFSSVRSIEETPHGFNVFFKNNSRLSSHASRFLINCAGLYADQVAWMLGVGKEYRIVPFRGEYFKIRPEKSGIIRSMIYPVPNLKYPFLGVHWTKKIDGSVAVGPNAVLAFGRESYSTFAVNLRETIGMLACAQFYALFSQTEFWRLAAHQFRLSVSKKAFLAEAAVLVKGAQVEDLLPGTAGNRAQLINRAGEWVEDLVVERRGGSWHVLNVVSPGFTCAMPFAQYLVDQITQTSCS